MCTFHDAIRYVTSVAEVTSLLRATLKALFVVAMMHKILTFNMVWFSGLWFVL